MKRENTADKVFTVREASRYLLISPSTIYRYIKKGTVPSFKERGRWRLKKSDLARWRKERGKKPAVKWRPLGFSDLQTGGRVVPIKSLRLMDSIGCWHRYRVSTVQGILNQKATKVPAWARLAKDKEGKIGVLVTGAHFGLLKIGRSRQSQPYFLTSFDALSKRAQKALLNQIDHELLEEGGTILAKERKETN